MKKISIQLSDKQYKPFELAAEKLRDLGIPVQTQFLVQTIISNKSEDEICNDFLSMMKKLISEGKQKLRQKNNTGIQP